MNDRITITLSHPDRFGQYRVTAESDSGQYMDFFNPANEWRRRVFSEAVIAAFGWAETPHTLQRIGEAVQKQFQEEEQKRLPPREDLALAPFSEIKANGIDWLWPGRIAQGKICVIAGDPGLGKSLLSLDIAAHLSRGAPWPDDSGSAPITNVMLLNAEDDYVDTVRPRLVAANADLSHVFAATGIAVGSGESKTERQVDIMEDVDKLERNLEQLAEPRLLIVDPISSFLGTASETANAEIRKLLQPLTMMAQRTKTAVLLISHLRKQKGSNLHRIIGSIAFAAVARSAFVVKPVSGPGNNTRQLIPVKSNLGSARTAVTFAVEPSENRDVPRIRWGEALPHEGIELPAVKIGRPGAMSPEAILLADQLVHEKPTTVAELHEALGELAPAERTLYRFVAERYGWSDEKSGRHCVIAQQRPEDAASPADESPTPDF